MKIERYQGFMRNSGEVEINDHQNCSRVVHIEGIPKKVAKKLLDECLIILNDYELFEGCKK